MNTQNILPRNEALLETIRQGLFISAMQKSQATLGDRSAYIGMSEIAKYAECKRAAVAAKTGVPIANVNRLLTTQRGHWFEQGIKEALTSAQLNNLHQLEIHVNRKSGPVMAHLDFTLVWNGPAKAVRILEIKSTGKLPDTPWDSHKLQAQGQVNMLRHYWNKPVFTLKDQNGNTLHDHLSFPEICKKQLSLEVSTRPSSVSIESWILYLSMHDARAFGPFTFSPESHADILGYADAFYADLKAVQENPLRLAEMEYPKGFYPLCSYCAYNADCPKFSQGDYQPQWEPAISKMQELKKQQENIHAEITEIESALKEAHKLSGAKDWIDTGAHRFRMAMVSGRKSLNQEALKAEISDILHGLGSEINVENLFASCMKQGASFPRLTISPINA